MGMSSGSASPLANPRPTRSALNPPGPMTAAMPVSSCASIPVSASSPTTAGASSAVWLFRLCHDASATTRPSSASATPA